MNNSKQILIADDNSEIREIVRILLESENYEVIEAVDGQDAVDKVTEETDLIILDMMMPNKSGLKACLEIREKTSAPILFLTAKTQDSDKQLAFSSGSDDFLSKPFSYTELVARVKALLRRYYVYRGKEKIEETDHIVVKDLKIHQDSKSVYIGEKEISLTDIEYQILMLLASKRRKVFSAENIYESVWRQPYFYTCNNTVMVHIRNLRNKLEDDPQHPKYVKTVWGKGYKIE
ncbi:response regulator transcription factor [Paenibacillus silvae]|uniref:DNA-binding response regulator n=1 Tax=Paenibacillus silvae TaxID=1325358 RepID=A0ABQ1ZMP4_9BACL|nr:MULTISPECIES: response regulator transcription factor [Paenibacillus]MBU5354678.1 response regulator transcription factor [Paenibacillus barcinonensis]MCK6077516.1 response regulator transcription factor [Paenibacillus silvae]MCK6151752.1 response regulator transcription factor [Paenibacillus silvae]MCK6270238.1 response regulator transcription factor [Paenibacillus silvae]MDM5279848.1 response regulator transcription factor [Paenibacillus silvae]